MWRTRPIVLPRRLEALPGTIWSWKIFILIRKQFFGFLFQSSLCGICLRFTPSLYHLTSTVRIFLGTVIFTHHMYTNVVCYASKIRSLKLECIPWTFCWHILTCWLVVLTPLWCRSLLSVSSSPSGCSFLYPPFSSTYRPVVLLAKRLSHSRSFLVSVGMETIFASA